MKNQLVALALLGLYAQAGAQAPKTAAKKPAATPAKVLTNKKDSLSYAIGYTIANNLKQQKVQLNTNLVSKALKDVLNNQPTTLTEENVQGILTVFQQEMQDKAASEMKKDGAVNKQAGEAFLAENKKKEGIVTLPSGLQYQILKTGDGPKPAAEDKVKTHYHGTLINGKVFDSSVDRGEPVSFGVNQVIKGWTEALQLMPVGSKWKLFIPSELAYGEYGPPSIGPSQTLIFEVELLGIEPK